MTEKPITLLIVDDEEPILNLLKSFFAEEGCQVLTAENAETALELKHLDRVDAALIDIRLPGAMDGHELVKVLNDRFPGMAKLLMSAQGDIDDAIAAFSEQVFAFVKKPFSSLREIRLLIEGAVKARRLEIQNREFAEKLSETNWELEQRVTARTEEIQRYQSMLSHLFSVSSRIGLVDHPDRMLEFVCRSIVEAGTFRQAAILLSDDKFRVRNAGIWMQDGVPEQVREALRSTHDQPLRPFEFDVRQERIGGGVLMHPADSADTEAGEGGTWLKGNRLSVPVVRNDGTVFGYLTVGAPFDDAKPSPDVVKLLETMLSHGALHLEAHALREELRRRAADLEKRVQERTSELKLSQEKFSRLINSTTDVVYITDQDGKLVYLNEAFTNTLGYIGEYYLGRSLRVMLEELATDNPMNRQCLDELESLTEDHKIFHVELLTRQGDKRTLEINRTLVKQDHEVVGTQGIVRDVTEHRALLQQLIAAERLAATGRLAAGVAHEINNPLQAIASHLNAIKEKNKSGKDSSENVEMISEGVARIRQIVHNMLDLHRAPASSRVSLDLNELSGKVAALIGRQLKEAGVELVEEYADSLSKIDGSPQELQQLLLNLLLNAVEAMPKGGTVTVTTRETEKSVEVSVKDTGVGIPQDQIGQIFEPFFTYKPSGGGTGLGLYLSRNIMDLHHGSINVTSEAGKGACFTLSFPKS